jgi:ATP-dependent RNA helicase RhlB
MMKFTELSLTEELLQGIRDADFTDCLPVQERTYEYALLGRDVLVQSQTGSGKTAAFLVSIFQLFTQEHFKFPKRALIIAPTRELAIQIEDEAKLLGAHLPYNTGCFYGGVGYHRQEDMLRKGVDVVIGTPGRLIDLNQSGKLRFDDIGILVIDEADRLFDMGFLPDLRRMIKKLPATGSRQTMLFSATLSGKVRDLAAEYMTDPAEVEVAPEQVTVQTVTQMLYHVDRDEKMKLLLGVLKRENPGSALIFTNMKSRAMEVAKRLAHNGFVCEYIIGDLPQSKRLSIINAMKSGALHILVATDVAARGLHINDLDLVVNYDLPEDPEAYVHRIGRTARVGKSGKAITIVCERYVYGLEAIEALINIKIPVAFASEEDFFEDASAGMRFHDDRRRPSGDSRGGRSADRGGRGADRGGRSASRGRSSPRPLHAERPGQAEKAPNPQRHGAAQAGRPAAAGERAAAARTIKPERVPAQRPSGSRAAVEGDAINKKKPRRRRPPSRSKSTEASAGKVVEYYGEEAASKKKKGAKLVSMIKGIFSRKKPASKS